MTTLKESQSRNLDQTSATRSVSNEKEYSLREQLYELLAFLRTTRPQLAELLKPAVDRARPEDTPPEDEPIESLPETPHDRGRPLATFIMGCGRGAWAKELLKASKNTHAPPPVIVVEPDRTRMLMSLLKGEWDSIIEDPCLRFAVGGPILKVIEASLPEHVDPLLEFDHGVAIIPGEKGQHPENVRTSFEKAAGISRERFVEDSRKQAASKNSTSSLPNGSWNVAAVASDSTTALHSLARSMMQAASQKGHHAQTIRSDHLRDPFLGSTHQRAILDANPDLCISFMQPGSHLAPWRNDYLSLVLVSSNPRLHPVHEMPWSSRDFVVITDPDFAEPFTNIGVSTTLRGMATDLPDLDRIREEDVPECDVCMVANLSGARAVIPHLSTEMFTRVEEIAKEWATEPQGTLEERVQDVTSDHAQIPLLKQALAYEATLHRRVHAALAVADAGFSIRIHGNSEWKNYIRGTSAEGCWHGPLDPIIQQPAMFHTAKVSVNVNSFATPAMLNMRSLDIPAAQGVLLCDDRPQLHQSFDVGTDVLAFQNTAEIPQILSEIIGDPSRRNAMATSARARVLREHSWSQWWNWAETQLRSHFKTQA